MRTWPGPGIPLVILEPRHLPQGLRLATPPWLSQHTLSHRLSSFQFLATASDFHAWLLLGEPPWDSHLTTPHQCHSSLSSLSCKREPGLSPSLFAP
jgi:hypothetical protein